VGAGYKSPACGEGGTDLRQAGQERRMKMMDIKKRNTAWRIKASSPLLRPGLEISIVVSEKYVVEETEKLLNKVREINLAFDKQSKQ